MVVEGWATSGGVMTRVLLVEGPHILLTPLDSGGERAMF